jgi:hypothetical protein
MTYNENRVISSSVGEQGKQAAVQPTRTPPRDDPTAAGMGQQAKLADLAWCQSAQMSSPQTTPGMLLLAGPSDLVRSYLELPPGDAGK